MTEPLLVILETRDYVPVTKLVIIIISTTKIRLKQRCTPSVTLKQ